MDNTLYPIFKIYTNNNKITCTGCTDETVPVAPLLELGYNVHKFNYNEQIFEIVYTTFDDFITPMYICVPDNTYTIELFLTILPNILVDTTNVTRVVKLLYICE